MAAVTQRRKTKRTNVPGLYRVEPSRVFPDGGYEVRYRDADYRTRRKTFRTKQDALDFQASVRTDKNRGDFIDPRKAATRFGEVADKWFEGTAHLRPTTRAAYRSMLKTYIKPGLGDYPIGKITPSVLRAFMAGLPDGLSATRKRHVFRTLVPIFKLAVDDGMIRMSPTGAASVKGSVPKAVRRNMLALTAEQVASVAEAVTPRYRVLVYFAAYTGMRAGEITGLRVRHLDMLRGRVTVEDSISDVNGELVSGPTKNGKGRKIGLPPFLKEMLAGHLAGQPHEPDDFVFPGPDGKPMRHANFYGRHFKVAVQGRHSLEGKRGRRERPAVPGALPEHLHGLRFHDLRHTCASLLIAQGTSPKAIQERLGHSSIAITFDRYGHLFDGHEEPILTGLEETFQRAASEKRAEAAEAAGAVVPLR